MVTLAEQQRELMDELTRRVQDTFDRAREAHVSPAAFADVKSIARAMTAALPHVYDQLIGPFYDTAGLTQWWGVSRQAVNKAVATGSVIACQLDGGGWVYPTWQFTDTGTVHPHLLTLWRTLRDAADPWTCAVWLRSPQPELDDRTAADWIVDGHPLDAALELARADAQRWAA
ncbi:MULTISPECIES: hypothetical protein [unclassified Rhodococcus (in: high G+C Gram-positive bacteria)]|uniref:hypothetical protein n=1 Tax=unclassified Rhodococcus (in: high G+C Gram-positive bacteria) TaxID=192944 RepID=UPI00146B2E73|nr:MULTISPECIES: hypothetical protein [unclassified Rhodococcus (in: high G+C Gram-positive bacteria)]MBF0662195.1 hypothetical protein [Rhodococcus sp. (in: high G+C Gram-positive bacteria)]NMD93963.1 hypothetical protein [Rhodococcus sp. BL-253-APC-6A1W]NME77809.1 hypothetical protein [Rhodococcus sp. 105337]